MRSLEESVVTAMDGTDKKLFPFLPYIFQDIWEIGADPNVIISLIRKELDNFPNPKVLDLGCGKGAVSIKIAQQLNCMCHGLDAVPQFIDEANKKAREYKVNHLCKFEVADIREAVNTLPAYDIIILGAIGTVFGDYNSTLTVLSKHLNKNGLIIMDDSYIEDNSKFVHPLIQKLETIHQQIEASGMQLVDEVIFDKMDIKDSDDHIFSSLEKRCLELIRKYPHNKQIFENYIEKQREENYILENKVVSSTLVIKLLNPD